MTLERRGRPRKLESTGSPTTPTFEEKPREERSYKDFFPDLNIKEPLPIINLSDQSIKSPSNDEYETASEEPSESELFETVEYDMDEQGDTYYQTWLQLYNEERKKEKLGLVSGDLFESIIDQLEKEWFDLIKSLPKKTNDEPPLPEDSKCAICDDGECENSNAIVFCDGCNLAVHQDCYGIPYIPEGQWLCRKCMVSPENPVSCIFCPGEGGAFKQTTTNQWGHLLCAIWIPEVGLSNSVYMEPIDNIENVPKSRWKLTCYICRRRHGACIQCDNKNCFVAFHVTCARWARLCMRMKLHGTHYDGVVLKAYCERHTPKDYKEVVNVDKLVVDAQRWFMDPKRKRDNLMPRKRYIDEEDDDAYPALTNTVDSTKSTKKQRRQQAVSQLLPASKAARAHQHQYSAGAPIAPEFILDKLERLKSVKQATNLKKKSQVVTNICRYWSLKRESRRGAPLLKRLHLEPWTASASQLKQSEVEKAHKASSMITLRADLEKLRLLSEQVQKREKLKLDRLRKQKAYLETIFYPIEIVMRPVIDELMELDKKDLFKYPVTRDMASDYYDIVKTPMSFADVLEKLSLHSYLTLDDLADDLSLIWKNSMLYNQKDTLYYKLAQRLEKTAESLIAEARLNYETLEISKSGLLDVKVDPEIFSYAGDSLKIDTTVEQSSSGLSSMSTISSDSSLSLKRRVSDVTDTPMKKPKEEDTTRKVSRITRSKTQNNMRTLRSRSITKDIYHPVKLGLDSLPEPKRKRSTLRRQVSTISEPASESSIVDSPMEGSLTEELSTNDPPTNEMSTNESSTNEPSTSESPTNESITHRSPTNETPPIKIVQSLKPKAPFEPKKKDGENSKTQEEVKVQEMNKAKTQKTNVKKKALVEENGQEQEKEKIVTFQHGELVWGRVYGFPPHPALITDPKRKRGIPKSVTSLKAEQANKVLVEFLQVSEAHTWGWLAKEDIYPFGNKDLDIKMLHYAKKTRKPHRIREVKIGYTYACGLIHVDPLPQLKQVFPKAYP
ncbi:hypothetical protein INT47_009142 [Mucor saturninus]|uniref:Bromodomain and PHD finger-containing protein n=1 Tax=Mucor saturninus TaxID=64648 RepID=A0A8H7RMX9_9FUNG|nr:hypothetical protein INT47_009142 [Mucor saturninus]